MCILWETCIFYFSSRVSLDIHFDLVLLKSQISHSFSFRGHYFCIINLIWDSSQLDWSRPRVPSGTQGTYGSHCWVKTCNLIKSEDQRRSGDQLHYKVEPSTLLRYHTQNLYYKHTSFFNWSNCKSWFHTKSWLILLGRKDQWTFGMTKFDSFLENYIYSKENLIGKPKYASHIDVD